VTRVLESKRGVWGRGKASWGREYGVGAIYDMNPSGLTGGIGRLPQGGIP